MSFAYNSAFQSNQDENGPQGLRRMKRESLATKTTGPGATKRAALGTISLNAERKQPFRAAKVNLESLEFTTFVVLVEQKGPPEYRQLTH